MGLNPYRSFGCLSILALVALLAIVVQEVVASPALTKGDDMEVFDAERHGLENSGTGFGEFMSHEQRVGSRASLHENEGGERDSFQRDSDGDDGLEGNANEGQDGDRGDGHGSAHQNDGSSAYSDTGISPYGNAASQVSTNNSAVGGRPVPPGASVGIDDHSEAEENILGTPGYPVVIAMATFVSVLYGAVTCWGVWRGPGWEEEAGDALMAAV